MKQLSVAGYQQPVRRGDRICEAEGELARSGLMAAEKTTAN